MTARALFTRENAEDDADDLNAADENGGLEPEPETKDEAAREGKPIVAAAEREPERYRALFDCPAEEPEDLEFFKGDEILVTGKVSAPSRIHNCSCRFLSHGNLALRSQEDEWFTGTNVSTGKTGTFPGNYVTGPI